MPGVVEVATFVAFGGLVFDWALLASANPWLHKVGWVIDVDYRSAPTDAPLRPTRTGVVKPLSDGSLACWDDLLRMGVKGPRGLPPTQAMRAIGVPVSAVVTRQEGVYTAKVRVRFGSVLTMLAGTAFVVAALPSDRTAIHVVAVFVPLAVWAAVVYTSRSRLAAVLDQLTR